jgi:hypothetical protein
MSMGVGNEEFWNAVNSSFINLYTLAFFRKARRMAKQSASLSRSAVVRRSAQREQWESRF